MGTEGLVLADELFHDGTGLRSCDVPFLEDEMVKLFEGDVTQGAWCCAECLHHF